MEVCAAIQSDSSSGHQTFAFVMIDFLDIEGQVAGSRLSSYILEVTSAGTGEYFPPFQFLAEIVKVVSPSIIPSGNYA
ncbi:hypothetical protein TNCV_4583981 [Trichonephila clavipes]|nr:hypothetical protein TNCV_4583981 [Trichonephila clavipes]